MILIVSNRRDITTDYVVAALRRREIPFYRLNSELVLRDSTISWIPSGWRIIDAAKKVVRSEDITGAYFRRPLPPRPLDDTAEDAGPFIIREATAMLRGLLSGVTCKWISDPHAIEAAEDKLTQLRLALDLGFLIPETIVTNDVREASRFISAQTSTIVKF